LHGGRDVDLLSVGDVPVDQNPPIAIMFVKLPAAFVCALAVDADPMAIDNKKHVAVIREQICITVNGRHGT